MPRLTMTNKAVRTLKFLLGVRNPYVYAALEQYGFTAEDVRDGWERLAALGRDRVPSTSLPEPPLLKLLDEFENQWFPVARHTLEQRHPGMAEALFENLAPTKGVQVAITVKTFVDRLAEMERGEGEFKGEGPEARALLARRGLHAERIQQANDLLDRLNRSAPADEDPGQQEAEAALWRWYLEWTGIARVAIRDRRLLRSAGLIQTRRRTDDGDDESAEDAS